MPLIAAAAARGLHDGLDSAGAELAEKLFCGWSAVAAALTLGTLCGPAATNGATAFGGRRTQAVGRDHGHHVNDATGDVGRGDDRASDQVDASGSSGQTPRRGLSCDLGGREAGQHLRFDNLAVGRVEAADAFGPTNDSVARGANGVNFGGVHAYMICPARSLAAFVRNSFGNTK